MVLTKVVENTILSVGEINTKVRVRSLTLSEAKNRAIRRAFLYNGYTPQLKRKEGIEVEIVNAKEIDSPLGNFVWLIEVNITGIN